MTKIMKILILGPTLSMSNDTSYKMHTSNAAGKHPKKNKIVLFLGNSCSLGSVEKTRRPLQV